MHTKRILFGVLFLIASCVFLAGCPEENAKASKTEKSSDPPNIIFLLTDDQRNDTLGCAGHPIVKTPNIDSLAADGVRFENCFVTTSICAASRASILTGLMERTHGYTFGKPPVDEKYTAKTYPALLKNSGYRTGFIGKYGCSMEKDGDIFDYKKVVRGPGYTKQPDGTVLESTEIIGNFADDFIKTDDSRPFCLSVSFNASHAVDGNHEPGKGHYPYPLGLSELYEDQKMPLPELKEDKYFNILPEFLQTSMNRKRYVWRWDTPEKYQTNMRAYFRMLTGIDNVVGKLVKTLEEKGMADNTIIIYTADNGYYMADRGFAGKWSHFEESLRIPLVVYDPRLPENKRGRVVEQTALNIDFAPTMLQWAGIETPKHYEGRSLIPVIDNDTSKTAGWQNEFYCEHLMNNPIIPKWEGVRGERYKYARYFEQSPPAEFLHDLKEDPTEYKNLIDDPAYQDVYKQMRSKLDKFIQKNPRVLLPQDLKCENKSLANGVGEQNPRLSWIINSPVRGQKQTAYQVVVSKRRGNADAGKGDVWDSGKVKSGLNNILVDADLKSSTRYYWTVRIWDKDGKPTNWAKPAWFKTGLLKQKDFSARWINDGKQNPENDEDFYKFDPAPLFRKEFTVNKPVANAELYITGLGYYKAAINGNTIGDHILDPGWTDFAERVYYSNYNISRQLKKKANCLAVTVGNGWYNPLPLKMWGHKNIRNHLAVGRPRFIAQINIRYRDGSTETIISDENWKVTEGPILRNSIYLGEIYDARKKIDGWQKPGFDDSEWKNASLATEPLGKLVAQPLEPIRATKEIKPVKITEPEEGVYIVDMGQNFSGLPVYQFDLPSGTQVNMRYGELLYDDGTLNPMTSVCGQIKNKQKVTDGLQSHPGVAWQRDVYFAAGTPETYTPSFTWHAFRYIELTGLSKKPAINSIKCLRLNSDVKRTGTFTCSNDLLNSIQEICDWTFLSNILSVQSDCPHRERFGYGGDLINTNETFMFNYDMLNFYNKAVTDWDDSKLENGMLTDTAPSVGIQYCGVGWAMAHPHTALKLYQYYGDKRIIERQYPTAKKWLALVTEKYPDHIVKRGLSDHESLTKKPAPPMVTPLYFQSAEILAEMADILDRKEDAKKYKALAKNIKKAYNENFVDAETGKCQPGTQSSQSFALFTGILPEDVRPAALKYLLDLIESRDGKLSTGIFGTRYMLELLSDTGNTQTAYEMVNHREYPGWGNMIKQGATTLWEHWKFSDNTFSHNHPMFGSVSQWFYNWLGGIQAAPNAVAFDKIIIRPQIPKDLQWVKCGYNSAQGLITSNWKRDKDTLTMKIIIPANAEATVYIPSNTAKGITENGIKADKADGVDFVKFENNAAVYNIKSGNYLFTSTYKP